MLKIYRASNFHGKIELQDNIVFDNKGRFDTGRYGYGDIISGNGNCKIANYEFTNLYSFEKYIKTVERKDGFVKNFMLFNPKSYEMLKEEFRDIKKTVEEYIKYDLEEEAILLLTQFVYVNFDKSDNRVKNIFGRTPECGLYLLKPDAQITMKADLYDDWKETSEYEVLQSKSLGKRLTLQKFDRKI